MFESSLFLGLIARMFQYINGIWKESLARKVVKRITAWFSRLFRGSAVFNWLAKDGLLARVWENSAAFRIFDGVINFIPLLLRKLYLKFRAAFDNSRIFRLIAFIARNVPVLAAIYIFILLVFPANLLTWNNRYSAVAAVALLGLFIIHAMADGRARLDAKVFDVYLFIFAAAVVLAQVFSLFPSLSVRYFIFYLVGFALVLVLASSIRTVEQLSTVIEITLAGAAIMGIYGVYQSIKGVPLLLYQVDTTLNEGMPGRVFSTLVNPNNFAQVIVMLFPFFMAVAISAKGWQKKVIFGLAAVPLLISMFATGSRSGMIGLAVAVLVFIFLVRKSLIILLIALGIVAIPFLPDFVIRRIVSITNLQDTSTSYRFDVIKTMWPVIKDYWYTGVGLDPNAITTITAIRDYTLYSKDTVPLHLHNVYLQVWIETGIVGLLSFLGFIVRLIKKSFRGASGKNTDPFVRNFLKAGLSGMLGVLVISIAEYIWYDPRVMMLFWVLAGLMLAAVGIASRQNEGLENDGRTIDARSDGPDRA